MAQPNGRPTGKYRGRNCFAPFALAVFVIIALMAVLTPTAANALNCSTCNTAINGKYITAEGKSYHPEHLLCDYCRKPINGPYSKHGNFTYHTECYHKAQGPFCAVCSQPIEGPYTIDHHGNPYHSHHEVIHCSACDRIIVPGTRFDGRQYQDGRYLCNKCLTSAVNTDDQIGVSERRVRQILANYGIVPPSIPITLADKAQLAPHTGKCWHRTINGITTPYSIQVLYGLPRTYFEMTLAHELMHAWIHDNNNTVKKDDPYHEGSCQLAAYFILAAESNPETYYFWRVMEKNRDPVYGQGYQAAKTYAERYGVQTWLRSLRNITMPISASYIKTPEEYVHDTNASSQPETQSQQQSQPPPVSRPAAPQAVIQTALFPSLMRSGSRLIGIVLPLVVIAGYIVSHLINKKQK